MQYSKVLAASFCFILILVSGLATLSIMPFTDSHGVEIEKSVVELSDPLVRNFDASTVLDAPIQLTNLEGAFEGYNLFLLGEWNTTSNLIQYFLVITDMNGDSIVEKYLGNNFYSICVEFINSTTLLTGTDQGAALWNYYDDTMVYLNVTGHHEYEYNPINNTFFTLNYYRIEIEGELYQFDYIEEYDINGTLVWSMDTHSFISHTQWCPFGDMWADARDITHSNTVYFDADEDVIYYNSRNTNTFYKIDHATATVEWGVGEYGDFTLFNINGIQKNELFYHGHAVERVDNNTFILFDNDYHNQENPSRRISRIIEITIDTDTMTANESWVWEAPSTYWSIRWGDADRLANGNRLGTFGTESHPGSALSARLVEVNDSGDIVWEMSFEKPGDLQYIVYRMERILFSPLLESHESGLFGVGEDVELSWSAWYNFRPKQAVLGNYILYLNEGIIDTGTFNYDSYWRPRDLSFNLGPLSMGTHNVTLSVSDDGGHYTNSSVVVEVASFVIDRVGPIEIEDGIVEANITWSGVTDSPLQCNITLNGTLDRDIIWNGEDIVLDLTILSPGEYETELRLYQGTTLLHVDNFLIRVYPQEVPQFISIPSITSIIWSVATTLQWEVFDWSPTNVRVYLDSVLMESSSWAGGSYDLDWLAPLLDVGTYNITVELIDVVNLRSTNTIIVDVIPISPPIISSQPANKSIVWGSNDVEFNWIVYGGVEWKVYKDGVELHHGNIEDIYIDIELESWQDEGWRIATYNLTLVVWDQDSFISATSWIEIIYDPGDPFADVFIKDRSEYYLNGDNAVGAPDGKISTVYMDYSNGYITLDMGLGEEIIDGTGDDFQVYAANGEYMVFIAPSLDIAFTQITGTFSGNTSLDISSTGLGTARYVRVQYFTGDTVMVDAIEALNFNTNIVDSGAPEIIGPSDITMLTNETMVFLMWETIDQTPWSFKILVDNVVAESSSWNGDDISYTFIRNLGQAWNVTLVVEDVFGNIASDTVIISVEEITVEGDNILLYLGIAAIAAIPAIVILAYFVKKKRG